MPRIVKNPEDRKDELLEIGICFFLQGGTKNVSIQKVVKEANVATGLFYYYFKDKEDFLEQAIERYIDGYVVDLEKTVSDKSIPVLKRLNSLLEQFNIRFCEANKVADDESLNTPHHLALEGRIVQRLHATITEFVTEGYNDGSFQISTPSVTALFLVCGMVGVLQRAQFDDSKTVYTEVKRLVFASLCLEGK